VFQYYIELSSQYQRPRPPVKCSDHQLCAASVCVSRRASQQFARQQSLDSGVCMSRPASSDLDASPRGYQRPVRSPTRRASDAAALSTTYLRPPRRRSQSSTDAGYLLPTCQQVSASQRDSAIETSDSNLCGSDNVFEVERTTLLRSQPCSTPVSVQQAV